MKKLIIIMLAVFAGNMAVGFSPVEIQSEDLAFLYEMLEPEQAEPIDEIDRIFAIKSQAEFDRALNALEAKGARKPNNVRQRGATKEKQENTRKDSRS